MSQRLQVLVLDGEMDAIRKHAAMEKLSVGEYVRRTLREADAQRPSKSASAKLSVIRQAVLHSLPTADIALMNREIQQEYLD